VHERPFGPGRTPVAVIGQGTWQMEGDDEAEAVRAIERAVEVGMTHVDTAEMYGSGRVESIVGKALRGRRDRVFLASKVLPRNASYEGTVRACERSLRRLGTDHLDLYMLHWRGSEPLAETFRAFDELVAQGKIRAWGVSNFDTADMEEALAIAGEGRIACNQVLYHLGERTIEHELVPWCEAHGVAVVAYSPFGSGDFPTLRSPAGHALAEVAQTLGATARQVALAYLTRRPGTFAIPKASRVEHVAENAGAGDLVLDEMALARIERAIPRGPWRGLPTL
jgi:diketogulonate reductase-like aldo/keto reductase